MSRGLGRIQRECLRVIEAYEAAGKRPTTFNIVAEVYQIKRDRHDNRMCNDAQHTAVKRALVGLRKKGLIKGQQALAQLGDDGPTVLARCSVKGRAVRCCYWSIPSAPDLDLSQDSDRMQSNRRVAYQHSISVSSVRRARERQRAQP
jgi:hypothetical protein